MQYGSSPLELLASQAMLRSLAYLDEFTYSARFDPACAVISVERDIGCVGAAAGAVHVAYALAALRHDTLPNASARKAPFLAWTITQDGTRAIALGRAEA